MDNSSFLNVHGFRRKIDYTCSSVLHHSRALDVLRHIFYQSHSSKHKLVFKSYSVDVSFAETTESKKTYI